MLTTDKRNFLSEFVLQRLSHFCTRVRTANWKILKKVRALHYKAKPEQAFTCLLRSCIYSTLSRGQQVHPHTSPDSCLDRRTGQLKNHNYEEAFSPPRALRHCLEHSLEAWQSEVSSSSMLEGYSLLVAASYGTRSRLLRY